MTKFVFNEQVTDAIKDTVSAALGTAASQGLGDNDVGKPVKMGALQNYVLCSDNDPIEGFVAAIEPFTVNEGFAFGSVQRRGRKLAQVATGATVALLGYAIAAAQTGAGVAAAGGLPAVKGATATAATDDGAASNAGPFAWRVIRIVSGSGNAGSVVLLERV